MAALVASALLLLGACSSPSSSPRKTTTTKPGISATSTSSIETNRNSQPSAATSSTNENDIGQSDPSLSQPSGASGPPTTLGGYTEAFKRQFVEKCAGNDPAKQGLCRCVIDRISETVPFKDYPAFGNVVNGQPDLRYKTIVSTCGLVG